MADGLVLAFGAQRNEGYLRTWRLTDRDSGAALDITSWNFELRIHPSAGLDVTPELVVGLSAEVFEADTSSIRITDAANGEIEVYIAQADIAALSGRHQDISNFAFNLIITDTTGVPRALARGEFKAEPGV